MSTIFSDAKPAYYGRNSQVSGTTNTTVFSYDTQPVSFLCVFGIASPTSLPGCLFLVYVAVPQKCTAAHNSQVLWTRYRLFEVCDNMREPGGLARNVRDGMHNARDGSAGKFEESGPTEKTQEPNFSYLGTSSFPPPPYLMATV